MIESRPRNIANLDAPAPVRVHTWVFALLVAAVLFVGWQARKEAYLTAESGLGYAFGIVGAALMFLLLLYPLRKKARFMRRWGSTKLWFQAHMIMGVLGPVFILFHCNFKTGSANSTVALVFTLLVTGSGVVGRYIHTKIHHGLYGAQMSLQEMQVENRKSDTALVLRQWPELQSRLATLDDVVLSPCNGLLQALGRFVVILFWVRWTRLVLVLNPRHPFKITARRMGGAELERNHQKRQAHDRIAARLVAILRIAEFRFYERLFALWHLLHLPLFLALVLVALIHVFAVHKY